MPEQPVSGSSGAPGASQAKWSRLDDLGLQFRESMSGYLGLGETDPAKGLERGKREGTGARFDVQIGISNLGKFLRDPEHQAILTGTVSVPTLGEGLPIRDGRFNLFAVDPESGVRQMTYSFRFTVAGGETFFLQGHKNISDDPGEIDLFEDMTRLFTTVHRGEDGQAPVSAAGELYFKLRDGPALMASMKVQGASSWGQRLAAYMAFVSFAFGALRDEYLRDIRIFYDTQYENLVLSGVLKNAVGRTRPFVLVSGTHDKGFPWGDSECFWDVLLAMGDEAGHYETYCITDRVLEGLEEDIRAGAYRYRGPLYGLRDGYAASFSQMHAKTGTLTRHTAEIKVDFESRPCETVPVSFPVLPKLVRKMSSDMAKALREMLPGEHPLGIYITPHQVILRAGSLRIDKTGQEGITTEEWTIVPGSTFGEAEIGTFRNIKEPTLLYSYLCALRPQRGAARVQILSRTLRDEREHWVKDRLDAYLGSVVSRTSSCEMLMEDGQLSVKPLLRKKEKSANAVLFRKLGEPVLEVNNDHFPTAVFQRRIVEVQDPSGERCLALEEDMSLMRLEAVRSDRVVTVACIENDDKFKALDRVLDETGFDSLIESKLGASAKGRAEFLIAIKPNFMFAYDKRDHTTYTDPELVGHLAARLRARGFQAIKVVEAQNTYGEYFDKRSVREIAEYLGFDGQAGYEVVDMTEDATEMRHLGPHLGLHPVSAMWRDADFRISFAKNKTHAYSYYTLTLKNIYGALPLANKFKEYHCDRDIYHTTLEYLAAFPVDYGLIDAHVSADGPFGIFADPGPNETRTMLGGADLVAVDWIGASKMGIDPMVSPYIKLAVEAYGKPEIRLVGNRNPYRPWLNVPVALTLFTNKGLDASHFFGNLFYTAAAQMDETHFRHKDTSWPIRLLRKMTVPVRRTFFLRTGENPSLGNRIMSRLCYWLGF